jgi:hypothetical protein
MGHFFDMFVKNEIISDGAQTAAPSSAKTGNGSKGQFFQSTLIAGAGL